MSDGKPLVVDLKIQIPVDRVPPLIMAMLKKGPGAWSMTEMVQAANDSGMIATLVLTQPGSNA